MLMFFVQAEDGIRDRNVTGVQTCALPISARWEGGASTPQRAAMERIGALAAELGVVPDDPGSPAPRRRGRSPRDPSTKRSEERRVGKESRSRWARCSRRKSVTTSIYGSST